MGRKKSNQPDLKAWETAPNSENAHFGQFSFSLVTHERFTALSNGAKLIYLLMIEASAGKMEFTFSVGDYQKRGITKPVFIRARDELIRAGFLAMAQNNKHNRKPNKYRFSLAWRSQEK